MPSYKVTYHLLPNDVTLVERKAITENTFQSKATVGFSADDAGWMVSKGAEGSQVIAWEPQRIGTGLTQQWFDEHYPGAQMIKASFADLFKFTHWPTEYRVITQAFGANPQYYGKFGLPGHEGIDIRALHGTNIYSVADGEIAEIKRDERSGHAYGIYIRVNHIGNYQTTYAHLKEVRIDLDLGHFVNGGELIGKADNTGNSFGDHLHLTLKHFNGPTYYPHNIIDPTPFITELMHG